MLYLEDCKRNSESGGGIHLMNCVSLDIYAVIKTAVPVRNLFRLLVSWCCLFFFLSLHFSRSSVSLPMKRSLQVQLGV